MLMRKQINKYYLKYLWLYLIGIAGLIAVDWFTTDLETIEKYWGLGTIMLFDAGFLIILVIIKMIQLDWALSLVVFVPLVLIAIWGELVEKYQAKKRNEHIEAACNNTFIKYSERRNYGI